MSDIQSAKINTAGAYVCINGLHLFAIGSEPHDGNIPVIRIGGHREGDETGWQCAVREVFEETSLQIRPHFPQSTYVYDADHLDAEPSKALWQPDIDQEPAPFLVVAYHRGGITTLSLMYFASAEGIPIPSSEVKGILLLTELEIYRLCQEPLTLKTYLDRGGQSIMKAEFNLSLMLEPFTQLRLLSRILSMDPYVKIA